MKPNKPSPVRILTVNGGSSSIKFAMFQVDGSMRRILDGGIERIGQPEASFVVKGSSQGEIFSRKADALDHTAAAGLLMDWLKECSKHESLTAVGHRVVHGGPKKVQRPAAHYPRDG